MMKHTTLVVMVVLALGGAAAAQTPPAAAPADQQVQATQEHPKIVQAAPVPSAMKVTVKARITRGAPYSADTVTESAQVLADGNRIVRRTTARVWRDSEGRTRTEEADHQGAQEVIIADPVLQETWVLNPEARTAFRAGVFMYSVKGAGVAGGVAVAVPKTTIVTIPHDPTQAPPPPPPPPPPVSAGAVGVTAGLYRIEEGAKAEGKVTREDLGHQTIEGLTATGTRTTTVIPAGAIGNEQPIRVVSEQWYSPDLQLLVLTKFSDPRSGETTFRLTNISRAEPDRSLFAVPPDYTVKESKIQREPR
jgi:hypothetical protein